MSSQTATQQQPQSPLKLADTVTDFCKSLGISRAHFYDLVNAGKIKTIKIGAKTLVSREERDRILREGVR